MLVLRKRRHTHAGLVLCSCVITDVSNYTLSCSIATGPSRAKVVLLHPLPAFVHQRPASVPVTCTASHCRLFCTTVCRSLSCTTVYCLLPLYCCVTACCTALYRPVSRPLYPPQPITWCRSGSQTLETCQPSLQSHSGPHNSSPCQIAWRRGLLLLLMRPKPPNQAASAAEACKACGPRHHVPWLLWLWLLLRLSETTYADLNFEKRRQRVRSSLQNVAVAF